MDLLELERRRPAIPLLFVTPPASGPIISEDGKFVSEQTYWEKYYEHPDFNYEWVNGRLEEKAVSTNATTWMFGWLVNLLEIFLQVNKIAKLTRLETGFTVPLPPEKQLIRDRNKKKRKNVRKPDLGVVLKNNPVPLHPDDNSYDGILDLCIEAISYTTKKAEERDTIDKREEYEYARVSEFYILDDRKKETTFLRLDRWGIYQEIKRIDGDIIRSEVLPGFQFRVSDLYRQPSLDELVKDEVYQGFVMVKYQEEKKRADREQQEKKEALRLAFEERKEKQEALKRAEEEKKEALRLASEEKKEALRFAEEEKQEVLRLASEEKKEALRLASEEKKEALRLASEEKKEALRLASEERKEKEEALRLAEEKNKRLLAFLAQSGISLD